jgi:5'-3' exonuclease
MNTITTIIDADSICYLTAYNLQDTNDTEAAIEKIDSFVKYILDNTNCSHYLGFLGKGETFRSIIYPEYKSNRSEKPDWLVRWGPFIRERLVNVWKFKYSNLLEAEDACTICINHFKDKSNVIYAHIDKDGNSLEGNHYNYSTHTFWYSDKFGFLNLEQKKSSKKLKGSGLMWLYAQYCLGDKTDNIPSLKKGCGEVYVYNLLKDCTSEYQLLKKVYGEFLKHSSKDAFILNRQLITMVDTESFGFSVPELVEYKKTDINIFEL